MAAPISRSNAVVKDFAGLVTNSGPTTSSPTSGEATELVNLMPLRPGEMAARPGYRVVEFDDEGE